MPRTSRRTWVEDIVEYFTELGGEAHYSELYRHIEQNPRRPLGRSWQAVVRRTIEEHSSDSTIWSKRELPDLFRSVDGLGAGRWALRNLSAWRNHLILRSNPDSPWDDADGESYEFGRTVPNWTRVRPGDEAPIERIVDGHHFLIGVTRIGNVAEADDGRFVAHYLDYQNFAQPIPLPQLFAASISALDGYNPRNSISIIPEELFAPLLNEARAAEERKLPPKKCEGRPTSVAAAKLRAVDPSAIDPPGLQSANWPEPILRLGVKPLKEDSLHTMLS